MNDDRLIREIEKRRMFYDTKDLFYKDNLVKEKEWAAMAKILGLEVDFCKSRWKALRDGYVKAKNVQKEYRYAEKMAFLLPFLQSRRGNGGSSSSSSNKRYCDDTDGDADSLGENGDLLAAAAASAEIVSSRLPKIKRSSSPLSISPLGSLGPIPPCPKDVPTTDLDESYHFAMSLVPILSRMDRNTRRQAQVFILNGLGNFENPL
ncbi:unnamed protein product [Knipowitschia caucasica]|uniref:MADF domain-containing protein n=1 Tax=Knipowitschia caucasica TaxID=637954 RepID=A0AAV2L248_KNICA